MNTKFFSVRDNSLRYPKYPWVQSIRGGFGKGRECPECGASTTRLFGKLEVILERSKSVREWPDTFGCGAYPLLIVSGRVLQAWREESIGEFPASRIMIDGTLPDRLQGADAPEYFWLDGRRMAGAKFNFNASGFVGVEFCSSCGRRWDDISATYDRQNSGLWPQTFVEGSWTGANLFTTDLSPAAFFCTGAVVECARKHRHTNFRFVPVEAGKATWSEGIDYLGKKWPPYHPLRPSEGKTLDEWLEQLRNPTDRYDARVALLDLGKDAAAAVPGLTGMLDDEDDTLRREAALLLNAIGKLGVPLGAKGEAAARQHEEWFQKTLG